MITFTEIINPDEDANDMLEELTENYVIEWNEYQHDLYTEEKWRDTDE